MYGARQILVQGMVPLTDDTAWYPLVTVSHRGVPVLHYMFAHWYVFTTGSTEYNNSFLSLFLKANTNIARANIKENKAIG